MSGRLTFPVHGKVRGAPACEPVQVGLTGDDVPVFRRFQVDLMIGDEVVESDFHFLCDGCGKACGLPTQARDKAEADRIYSALGKHSVPVCWKCLLDFMSKNPWDAPPV